MLEERNIILYAQATIIGLPYKVVLFAIIRNIICKMAATVLSQEEGSSSASGNIFTTNVRLNVRPDPRLVPSYCRWSDHKKIYTLNGFERWHNCV